MWKKGVYHKSYQGGVLLTVLLLLSMTTLVFSYLLEDRQQHRFGQVQLEQHYQLKSMEALTLQTLEQDPPGATKGTYRYNIGQVVYQDRGNQWVLTATTNKGYVKTGVYSK